jgi:D-alanyl-D-alanine carboxypeptidase
MTSYKRKRKRKFNKSKFLMNLISITILVIVVFISGKFIIETTFAVLTLTDNVNRTDDILILVNKKHDVPKDYVPEELIEVDVRFPKGTPFEQKKMRKDAAAALRILFDEAEKEGIILYGVSGYRSFAYQKNIYDRKVKAVGKEEAGKYVAYPGQSEHQTGLAMDVTNEEGVSSLLVQSFGKTKEGQWLEENAHKFGFIIRYPNDKEDITGYNYEPWHLRYVGKKASEEIKIQGIVLEEYLQK